MATSDTRSRGDDLADRLFQGIQQFDNAPLPGARSLPLVFGLTRHGDYLIPMENLRQRVTDILVASKRVFNYAGGVVQEIDLNDGGGLRLVPLRIGRSVQAGANSWLANLFVCQHNGVQFPPPKTLSDVLLRSEATSLQLPTIKCYARRPVFDDEFILRGPGWHPDCGIMVHGPEVEPIKFVSADPALRALERLPIHLRTLLNGFCFRTEADLVNTLALMLTGLLINHFNSREKSVALVDSNQVGLGKTWLVRAIGIVLDGTEPPLLHFTTDEEELQKRICSNLRGGTQSLLLIDNAKVPGGGVVSSPTIEANSMAPVISLRILGKSENYARPNDILWALTMNETRVSPDLMSRGLPIQLYHEGKPEDRAFSGPHPLDYAREHRLEILGELAGMIVYWNQQGRPDGNHSHRCAAWGRTLGGILDVLSFPEFLTNYGEAAASFNSALDQLAALAESAINAGSGNFTVEV